MFHPQMLSLVEPNPLQMCTTAILDLSQLATASAAFKAAAAVLQTIVDESKQFEFHAILPQMLQVK